MRTLARVNSCLCFLFLLAGSTLFGPVRPVAAEPTRLRVHVLAHDAKLIGDLAGGARVLVRDTVSGKVLAEGTQLGSTGSTRKIIKEPHVRGESLYDTEKAAAFSATLDIDEPTWITVEASGPLGTPHNQASASQTFMMLPGRDIDGDGIVLELYGLIVNLLAPHAESPMRAGQSLTVEAGVKLLCTCPIKPESLWDANDYRVTAELWVDRKLLRSVPLSYAGRANVFSGPLELPPLPPGREHITIEIRIVAGNDLQGNYGSDRALYRLEK